MEILDHKAVKMYETSFSIQTRKVGEGTRIGLFKIVDGREELLIGFLNSYKEGMDYLETQYMREHAVFQKFVTSLKKALDSRIHLFDFDPPQWREAWDSSLRFIPCEFEGKEVTVEVCVKITTGYFRIMEVETDWIQVLHDPVLDDVVGRFAYELFRIFDHYFTDKLVTH